MIKINIAMEMDTEDLKVIAQEGGLQGVIREKVSEEIKKEISTDSHNGICCHIHGSKNYLVPDIDCESKEGELGAQLCTACSASFNIKTSMDNAREINEAIDTIRNTVETIKITNLLSKPELEKLEEYKNLLVYKFGPLLASAERVFENEHNGVGIKEYLYNEQNDNPDFGVGSNSYVYREDSDNLDFTVR